MSFEITTQRSHTPHGLPHKHSSRWELHSRPFPTSQGLESSAKRPYLLSCSEYALDFDATCHMRSKFTPCLRTTAQKEVSAVETIVARQLRNTLEQNQPFLPTLGCWKHVKRLQLHQLAPVDATCDERQAVS